MSRENTVLEYDRIVTLLAERAASALGAAEAAALEPAVHVSEIRRRLAETTGAVSVIMRKGTPGLGEFGDISHPLAYAEKGGSLTMAQLLAVALQLTATQRAAKFLKGEDVSILAEIARVLTPHPDLENRIASSILSDTEMSDGASPELRRIRRQIAAQESSIRAQLNKLVTSASYRDVLQDQVVTQRDGRWVVPVKAESARMLPGIVHDRSKGGATVFIEPQAVVNANNALKGLEIEERQEIDRVLAELSASVADVADTLRLNQDMLSRIDFIFAKGLLACDMKAAEPEIAEGRCLEIESGRHPLIGPEKVVPITLSVGDACGNVQDDRQPYNTLIITGPNTGGKTVTLKTVGLFVLMARAGLHLPASRAVIPAVTQVFADIGDEQSIEQSLSTFSSHMRNIVGIVEKADADSIVFLDELGAGTDPTEGAALAIAILETLAARGCLVLATTHYTELKKYALAADGVENASMEFDVETLSPTYRLRVGLAGRSNAFEISRKLGLPESVVARAQESMDSGSIAFEDVIGQAERDSIAAEAARAEAEDALAEIEKERDALEREMREFEEKRAVLLDKARSESRGKIAEAEEYAEIVRAELKALLDDAGDLIEQARAGALTREDAESAPSRGDFYRRLDENRKALRRLDEEYRENDKKINSVIPAHEPESITGALGRANNKKQSSGRVARSGARDPGIHSRPDKDPLNSRLDKDTLRVGDTVRLATLDAEGEVATLPDERGDLQILVGRIRMTVPIADLRPARDAARTRRGAGSRGGGASTGTARLQHAKANATPSSIDVHGQTLDDAIMNVDKYIDDAMLAGYNEVAVVHGRGEGILRNGLRKMLRSHKHVKKIRSGAHDEGGDGATIVTLK